MKAIFVDTAGWITCADGADPAHPPAKARALFFQHRDKRFSFTDCTGFAIMRELRLTNALTTDRHFRQAGFQMLPAAGRKSRRPAIR